MKPLSVDTHENSLLGKEHGLEPYKYVLLLTQQFHSTIERCRGSMSENVFLSVIYNSGTSWMPNKGRSSA